MSMEAVNYWETNTILVAQAGSALQLGEEPTNHNRGVHGEVRQGSTLLSLKEAKELRASLDRAIKQYEKMETFVHMLPLTDAIKEIGEWAKGGNND